MRGQKSIATCKQEEEASNYIEGDEKPLGEFPEDRGHV